MEKGWVGVLWVLLNVKNLSAYGNGKVLVMRLVLKFRNLVEAFLLLMELKCCSMGYYPEVVSLIELVVVFVTKILRDSMLLVVLDQKLDVSRTQLPDQ